MKFGYFISAVMFPQIYEEIDTYIWRMASLKQVTW